MNRHSIEQLELRLLLTIGPSAAEQELLEHLNRMRADPQGELDRLFSSYPSPLVARDPAVQIAIDTFAVDGEVLVSQFSNLEPAPPLVWNDSLHDAALAHNELMIAHDEQSHQLPGESVLLRRVIDAGYRWLFSIEVGENVFAQSYSPAFAHAGFAIDWGSTATGIQDPPGHRVTMMNPAFEEVGISIVEELDLHTEVGPLVVTQNFGTRGNFSSPYLTGVVFDDVNQDGSFNAGEGLSDVSITVSGPGGFYSTTSMTAGGYQFRVAPGFWTITASGGGLGEPIVYSNVHIGVQNVKLDFEVDAEPVPDVYEITLTDGPGQHVVIADDGIASDGWMQFTIDGAVTQFRVPTTVFRILGGEGDDVVELLSVDAAFTGGIEVAVGDGDDLVDASLLVAPVVIDGGAGRDVLIGGAASDRLLGGAGSDDLRGGPGNDTLAGGAGRDSLTGGEGHDRLSGQGGSGDVLTGDAGDDTLSGGRGSDRLMEVGDADFILTDTRLLGLGTDSFAAIEFVVLFGGLEDNRIDASTFALPGARLKLAGGGGNDELIGSPLADLLIGNGGNDTLMGAGGNDTLLGGRHHDSLSGGDDDDVLLGRAGRDTLLGGGGDDYLDGGDGSDGLAGGTGSDLLTAGRDADTLFGNADDDTLFGGGGADVAIGGDGDDVLTGNSGHDTLTAGTGADDATPDDRTAGEYSEINELFTLTPLLEWMNNV
ncbi:MAG: CAP domain-containing protein [Planctomycetota bacterium]